MFQFTRINTQWNWSFKEDPMILQHHAQALPGKFRRQGSEKESPQSAILPSSPREPKEDQGALLQVQRAFTSRGKEPHTLWSLFSQSKHYNNLSGVSAIYRSWRRKASCPPPIDHVLKYSSILTEERKPRVLWDTKFRYSLSCWVPTVKTTQSGFTGDCLRIPLVLSQFPLLKCKRENYQVFLL